MMMMMNDELDDDYTLSEDVTAERLGGSSSSSKKRKSCKNKRRFTDEQIKSLETIFESESKLEPRKKLQLARELGLQPRQVAIWFQNKRARYKSKQLERDYNTLRASYNNLASQFETLKKEKQALQVQLQKLMKNSHETDGADEANSEFEYKPTVTAEKSEQRIGVLSDDDSCTKAPIFGLNEEERPNMSVDGSEHNLGVFSEEHSSIKAEYFGLDDEPDLLNIVDPAGSTLTSPENWGNLESGSSYQWWDVWS